MSQIKIRKLDGADVFASIRCEWQQLFAETECSPFLSWEWMSTWFDSFGSDRMPFMIAAYRDERLVGIMPTCLLKRSFLGMKHEQLSFMGSDTGGADYLDIISRPGDRAEVLSAIFEYLSSETSFDTISFDSIAEKSETVVYVRKMVTGQPGPRTRASESIAATCPQIDLTGGWDIVLGQSRRASNFKRKLKKLEKGPGFEYRSITAPGETAAAFERFLRLHDKRWETAGGSEVSGHPRLVAFHRRLADELAAAGLIRFDELWIDGECCSSIYALDDGETFYYYNSGYDIDLSHMSVGLVLLGLSIKNAIERGNTLYDFLRGDETYKFDWANQAANMMKVCLTRNSASAIAFAGAGRMINGLRNITRAILPTKIKESLGNRRRAWQRDQNLSDRRNSILKDCES